MNEDKRLKRIGDKLRNNINTVICKELDKINIGFVSTNLLEVLIFTILYEVVLIMIFFLQIKKRKK